jgi:hypothetical protein
LTFGIIAALLALASGLIYRTRLGRAGGGSRALTDDMIRSIEEHGIVQFGDDDNEPLDLRAIREEEERFLNETWDEPDEP